MTLIYLVYIIEAVAGGPNAYATDPGEEGIGLGTIYDRDIIPLDINLPDMSGYGVLARSTQRESRLRF